jgi:uncharacterized HhH-GPD family protein
MLRRASSPAGTTCKVEYDLRVTTATATDRLHFTGNEEADRLLVAEPMALLIGFALDQQVPVQWAFSAPLTLKQRIGSLDAGAIAATPPDRLEAAFRGPPALHRYPGSMAKRVQALAEAIERDYAGDAARVWTDATDGRDLERRIAALPGYGEMKVRSLLAVLAKRLGVRPPGIDEVLPHHPTLGDVDSAEALAEYQAQKRAYKAQQRAGG